MWTDRTEFRQMTAEYADTEISFHNRAEHTSYSAVNALDRGELMMTTQSSRRFSIAVCVMRWRTE